MIDLSSIGTLTIGAQKHHKHAQTKLGITLDILNICPYKGEKQWIKPNDSIATLLTILFFINVLCFGMFRVDPTCLFVVHDRGIMMM